MSDVVYSSDDHAAVALLDQRDRSVLDLERKDALRWFADDPVQRGLDHTTVRDDQRVALLIPPQDVLDRAADSRVKYGCALATGHDIPVRLIDPARPGFGKTFRYLLGVQ